MPMLLLARFLLLALATAPACATPWRPLETQSDQGRWPENADTDVDDNEPISQLGQEAARWKEEGGGSREDFAILQALVPLAMQAETARELRVLESMWRLSQLLAREWRLEEQDRGTKIPWDGPDAKGSSVSQPRLQKRPPRPPSIPTPPEVSSTSLASERSSVTNRPHHPKAQPPSSQGSLAVLDRSSDPQTGLPPSVPSEPKPLNAQVLQKATKAAADADNPATTDSPTAVSSSSHPPSLASAEPTATSMAFFEWLRSVDSEAVSVSGRPESRGSTLLATTSSWRTMKPTTSSHATTPASASSSLGASVASEHSDVTPGRTTDASPPAMETSSASPVTAGLSRSHVTTSEPTAVHPSKDPPEHKQALSEEGESLVRGEKVGDSLTRDKLDTRHEVVMSEKESHTSRKSVQPVLTAQATGVKEGMKEKTNHSSDSLTTPDKVKSLLPDPLYALVKEILGRNSSEDLIDFLLRKSGLGPGPLVHFQPSPIDTTAPETSAAPVHLDTTQTEYPRGVSFDSAGPRSNPKSVDFSAAQVSSQRQITSTGTVTANLVLTSEDPPPMATTYAPFYQASTEGVDLESVPKVSRNGKTISNLPTSKASASDRTPPRFLSSVDRSSKSTKPTSRIPNQPSNQPFFTNQWHTKHLITKTDVKNDSPPQKTETTPAPVTSSPLDEKEVSTRGSESRATPDLTSEEKGRLYARTQDRGSREPQQPYALPYGPSQETDLPHSSSQPFALPHVASQDRLWTQLLQKVIKRRPWLLWMLKLQ